MPYDLCPEGIELYRFTGLAGVERAVHFVSTRTGGVSTPPYDTLNLGLHVGDDPEAVNLNRRRLCDAIGLEQSSMTFGQQTHGSRIQVADHSLRGRGSYDESSAIEETDGLVTAVPELCIGVLVADCVPVLLCDPVRRVVAAVHAGWRGTCASIVPRAVRTMTSRFGCAPRDILAALGPAIGLDNYEVGQEVVDAMKLAMPSEWRGTVHTDGTGPGGRLDLQEANRLQLVACGVAIDHIEVAAICTFSTEDRFYSARRDGPLTGRFMAGILLRP